MRLLLSSPHQSRSGAARRYGLAVATVGLAFLLRDVLDPVLDGRAPFLLFVLPVLLTASIAGTGPGLLATLLSVASGTFAFVHPAFSWRIANQADLVDTALFTATAGAIVWLADRRAKMRAERERAEAALRDSEALKSAILQSALDGVVTITDEGRVVEWNPAAEHTFGVGLQTIRDWVVRFNARGPEGLIDGKAPGNSRKLNDRQRQALVNIVESGPMPAIHGVVRWRLKDLTLWIWEEFRISLSETTLSRELRSLGYRKLSARPRHYAQNPEALELFKKVSPPPWKRSGRASRTAPRSSCGGRTRPVSARKTRSPAAGPDGAPGPGPRTISGRVRSTSLGRSAPRRARAQPWCCPDAIRRP